jgi:hypothetical protein
VNFKQKNSLKVFEAKTMVPKGNSTNIFIAHTLRAPPKLFSNHKKCKKAKGKENNKAMERERERKREGRKQSACI